ncbi:ATP-binding protein [Halomonas caseinilytica]|uniref:ATP-binding protein n=1 Tax=Halomonas caseinilytica TaxID=438744 RepID=UPI0008B9D7DC|nr:ATP-binding protein [Halomonas caseinilytica]SEM10479.1 AAA domain-containing protein [Halomonas caseinilytica]
MSIQMEYQEFLSHLDQKEVHDDVRRMANLIGTHLSTLSEVGTARRARSSRLAPIATQLLDETPAQPSPRIQSQASHQTLARLHELKVGPFRGFMNQEAFDLSSEITLIYGANGTGKSSLCEALEAAMLGSIVEAQAKRLDHRTYCNNARLRRHTPPELTMINQAGDIELVQPNESEYRFCFIEKNRLDDFARIAAKTPGDQRQLIATLFGVEQFSEFVRGFNASLDDNLNLTGMKSLQLEQRRSQLASSEEVIRKFPENLMQLEADENELANRISSGVTFNDCCDWLLGRPDQQGRLPYVQAQLNAVPPPIHGATQERLGKLLEDVFRLQALWEEKYRMLATRASDVSYAQLYETVLELADGQENCPACGTSLGEVAENPFDRAKTGLQKLAELKEIQEQEQGLRGQLDESVRATWEETRRIIAIATTDFPEALHAKDLPPLPPSHTGDWLKVWIDGDQRYWKALLEITSLIEESDARASQEHERRASLAQERERLDGFRLEIERIKLRRDSLQQEYDKAQRTVAQFEEENRELIQEAESESAVIAHHKRIKVAYDHFLSELQSYLKTLPGRLLEGLGEKAKELYNSFNRSDPQTELLHALWLPLAENGKIEIEFTGEPGVRYNALIILSEGHIKCLGLAILLAKNITQGCPSVIFDDVVNAIDDEHRDGIWRTFFEDGHLDNKQIILTSHAEEFLHRIQQELGAERASAIKRYKFLPHVGEFDLRIDSDPPTKNYVLLAQQALEADEKRDALRHARPALESLTDRLWVWLGRRTDGRLELKLGGPRSLWELNNKCTKIRSAMRKIADQHEGGREAVEALDSLLNVGNDSIEWGYLNSGVHDSQRDHEFDRATVSTVIEAVVSLDNALNSQLRR